MEYEVCTECNHIGKRITDLPYGTTVGALKCADENKNRLKGNVAGCITEEHITVPYSNPYTVDGNPYTGSTSPSK